MEAAGRVCTGFSKPYVALYENSGTTVTYTKGQQLARGVEVSIEPQASEDNNFYADNQTAETGAGVFASGDLTLTVDGLHTAAERLIMGLPEAGTEGWIDYDDDQKTPFVGVGFIARYMSGGETIYVPTILPKVVFSALTTSAATQEEEIDWQTQELTAKIQRSDEAKHRWKRIGKDCTTESEAEEMIKTALGIE